MVTERMLYFTSARRLIQFGTSLRSAMVLLVTDASGQTHYAASSWVNASTVIGGPFLPLSAGTGFPLTGSLVANFQLFVKDGVNIPVTGGGAINAFSRTVSTNLFSALRVIDNTSASSFWDIGATGNVKYIIKLLS